MFAPCFQPSPIYCLSCLCKMAHLTAALKALKVTTGEHAQQLEQLSKSTMELPERITEARRGQKHGKNMGGPFSKKHHFCQILISLLAGIDNKRPLRFDIVIGKN